MSLRRADALRVERYLRDGLSRVEIEAMIPGIDLDRFAAEVNARVVDQTASEREECDAAALLSMLARMG